ncbi:MAG TPA: hypothetical protein VF597_00825 [Candidatus Saccharimonadales bacterium]|jgi:hypothetical protein
MDSTDTKINRLEQIQRSAADKGNRRMEFYADAQLRIEAARDLALHGVTSDGHLRDAEMLLLEAGEISLEEGDVAQYFRAQTEALFVETAVYGPVVFNKPPTDAEAALIVDRFKLPELQHGLQQVTADTLLYMDSLRRERAHLSTRLHLSQNSPLVESLRHEINMCRGLLHEQTFCLLMNEPCDGKQLAVTTGFYGDALEQPQYRSDGIYFHGDGNRFERHVQIKASVSESDWERYNTKQISLIDGNDLGNSRGHEAWPNNTTLEFTTARMLTGSGSRTYRKTIAPGVLSTLRNNLVNRLSADATTAA